MNTRKLFTDPTEEHADCCSGSCNSENKSETCEKSADTEIARPSGKAEEYLGEKL